MPFVTGLSLEGERECSFDDPSWSDVEAIFENLIGFDLDRADGTLTLEAGPDVQLSLTLGNKGELMVNWHDWESGESWVLKSDGASGTIRVSDAEYPACDFVDPTIALAAARAFFETGTRLARLPWRPLATESA